MFKVGDRVKMITTSNVYGKEGEITDIWPSVNQEYDICVIQFDDLNYEWECTSLDIEFIWRYEGNSPVEDDPMFEGYPGTNF